MPYGLRNLRSKEGKVSNQPACRIPPIQPSDAPSALRSVPYNRLASWDSISGLRDLQVASANGNEGKDLGQGTYSGPRTLAALPHTLFPFYRAGTRLTISLHTMSQLLPGGPLPATLSTSVFHSLPLPLQAPQWEQQLSLAPVFAGFHRGSLHCTPA